MKNILIILIYLISNVGFSQENKELKKIKCLKKRTSAYEKFQKMTPFIFYTISQMKKDLNKTKLM